jgi:hypothetical protein
MDDLDRAAFQRVARSAVTGKFPAVPGAGDGEDPVQHFAMSLVGGAFAVMTGWLGFGAASALWNTLIAITTAHNEILNDAGECPDPASCQLSEDMVTALTEYFDEDDAGVMVGILARLFAASGLDSGTWAAMLNTMQRAAIGLPPRDGRHDTAEQRQGADADRDPQG